MQSDLDNSKVILDVCSSCAFNYTVQSGLGNNIVILDVCSGCIINNTIQSDSDNNRVRYDINWTLGCPRFYDLALLSVLDPIYPRGGKLPFSELYWQ